MSRAATDRGQRRVRMILFGIVIVDVNDTPLQLWLSSCCCHWWWRRHRLCGKKRLGVRRGVMKCDGATLMRSWKLLAHDEWKNKDSFAVVFSFPFFVESTFLLNVCLNRPKWRSEKVQVRATITLTNHKQRPFQWSFFCEGNNEQHAFCDRMKWHHSDNDSFENLTNQFPRRERKTQKKIKKKSQRLTNSFEKTWLSYFPSSADI